MAHLHVNISINTGNLAEAVELFKRLDGMTFATEEDMYARAAKVALVNSTGAPALAAGYENSQENAPLNEAETVDQEPAKRTRRTKAQIEADAKAEAEAAAKAEDGTPAADPPTLANQVERALAETEAGAAPSTIDKSAVQQAMSAYLDKADASKVAAILSQFGATRLGEVKAEDYPKVHAAFQAALLGA